MVLWGRALGSGLQLKGDLCGDIENDRVANSGWRRAVLRRKQRAGGDDSGFARVVTVRGECRGGIQAAPKGRWQSEVTAWS